jgi:hypothetical protein
MRWTEHEERMREMRSEYKILTGKSRRSSRENNIKLGLRQIGYKGMEQIGLSVDKIQWRTFVNFVMKLWIFVEAGKLCNRLKTLINKSSRCSLY